MQRPDVEVEDVRRRRLEHDLVLMMLVQAVRVLAVARVLRPARRLHVSRAPRLRPDRAQKRRRVRSPGADLEVDRLQQRTALLVPVGLKSKDGFLKGEHRQPGLADVRSTPMIVRIGYRPAARRALARICISGMRACGEARSDLRAGRRVAAPGARGKRLRRRCQAQTGRSARSSSASTAYGHRSITNAATWQLRRVQHAHDVRPPRQGRSAGTPLTRLARCRSAETASARASPGRARPALPPSRTAIGR